LTVADLPEGLRLWVIHGSLPKTEKRAYRANIHVHVLAPTAGRAIAVAEDRRPGLFVVSCVHKGETPNVYVDEAPAVEIDRDV
jgi:hypothetical protein